MADNPSPRSPDPSASPSTRQLLEELDDLMQRMLELPVQQGEGDEQPPSAPSIAAKHTPEISKVSETVPKTAPAAPPGSPRSVHLLHVPATRVTVHGPIGGQSDGTRSVPATEVAAAPTYLPAGAEPLLPMLLEQPGKAQAKAGSVSSPPARALAPAPKPPSSLPALGNWAKAPATAPPAASRVPQWIVGINDTFDRATGWLGPVGRWLRGEQGRAMVGWIGVAMVLVALFWVALLYLG
jgi:hypothetical protein